MTKSIRSFAVIALIFTCHSTLLAQRAQPAEALIRQVFLAYKNAILQQQGQSAVSLVNQATLEYYARMKTLALAGEEKEVRQLSPVNKIMVLTLRHRIPLHDLANMTAEGVFVHAVNHGWIGKNSVLDTDIGRPQIFGKDASASYIKGGQSTTIKYRFTKEGGRWKIDLTALMPVADQAMSALIQKEGVDEDQFIIRLIESISGKKVSPSIWQPLQ